jgi:putative PIN family toxin of toxin-antitoxin system
MTNLFIDTNILISAIVFDKKELELIIRSASEGDTLYISEHILEEATRVFMKKFPKYLEIFDRFITISEIKIVKKKHYGQKINMFQDIRDQYDAHVIACAETMNCQYIITGDKDILEYKHNTVKSMSASDYLEKRTDNLKDT